MSDAVLCKGKHSPIHLRRCTSPTNRLARGTRVDNAYPEENLDDKINSRIVRQGFYSVKWRKFDINRIYKTEYIAMVVMCLYAPILYYCSHRSM